jgi:hypothetical protein
MYEGWLLLLILGAVTDADGGSRPTFFGGRHPQDCTHFAGLVVQWSKINGARMG